MGVRWGGEGLLFLLLALWLGSSFLSWDRLPTLGLGGLIGLAAGALYFELRPPLVLTAAALVLLGWDLDLFSRRLRGFSRLEGRVVSCHLRAVGLVAAWGLGLALLGLYLHFSLSFGLALLLASASFASLVAILRLAR